MTRNRHKNLIPGILKTILAVSVMSFMVQLSAVASSYKVLFDAGLTSTFEPYFHVVFEGNGVDHMNINLVNLSQTGLKAGDEIGVFDNIYCVGAAVITEADMRADLMSIPASANDTLEGAPNGYIAGRKVFLKIYRDRIVYDLYYDLVNNSKDIFEVGASMFAFIDLQKSTGNSLALNSSELKIYPNPLTERINIEFNLQGSLIADCKIFDLTGKLIKILNKEAVMGHTIFVWDGKNEQNGNVPPGNYYIKVKDQFFKILLTK